MQQEEGSAVPSTSASTTPALPPSSSPAGRSYATPSYLPRSCPGCYLSYGDFLVTYTGNAEELLKLVSAHKLILKEKHCDNCGATCRLDVNKKSFRCDKSFKKNKKKARRCNFVYSIFNGTWFSKAHLDFETNLKFVNLFCQDFFSYKTAKFEIKISDKTICDWASFCREVLISWCLDFNEKLGGDNCTVEIDESKFGKRKYNVGRVIEGQWVFGGICRESKNFFMVPVHQRNSETLLPIIKEKILPGTTIISDCWKAYNCLSEEGFKHITVNHKLNFVDPKTKAHTNTIERKWRDGKRSVPAFGRRSHHFVGYLATFMFKFHIPDPTKRFHVFMEAAAKLYPPK